MKKVCPLLLAMALALSLAACSGSQAEEPPASPTLQEPEMPEDILALESEPLPATAEEAYGKLLWDVYLSGMLPSDDDLWPQDLYLGFPDDREENTFAICDVDGDGADELVLLWDYAEAYAGKLGLVYGYQDGAVRRELLEFPILTFYENGIVTAGISHNQGSSGRFWPQELYRYDSDSDAYQHIGALSGWDQTIPPGAEDFPTGIDTDKDGMVYFHPGIPENPDGTYTPVDGPEFEAWWNSFLAGAQPLELPLQKLTEENIAALGYPEPQTVILPSQD